MDIFRPGDIILTRNLKEEDNSTPFSYWNHAAIYCGLNTNGEPYVIEAQEEPNTVLRIDWSIFEARYPTIKVVRFPIDNIDKMIEKAESLIGTKYRKIASIFRRVGPIRNRLGINCVGVVRQCYKAGTGVDPRWRTPDSILKTEHKVVWEKGI